MTDKEKQIEFLCSNRDEFNRFVYTPAEEAIKELERRRNDKNLEKKVNELLS